MNTRIVNLRFFFHCIPTEVCNPYLFGSDFFFVLLDYFHKECFEIRSMGNKFWTHACLKTILLSHLIHKCTGYRLLDSKAFPVITLMESIVFKYLKNICLKRRLTAAWLLFLSRGMYFIVDVCLFLNFIYLFEREREGEHNQGMGRERGSQTVSTEPDVKLE